MSGDRESRSLAAALGMHLVIFCGLLSAPLCVFAGSYIFTRVHIKRCVHTCVYDRVGMSGLGFWVIVLQFGAK